MVELIDDKPKPPLDPPVPPDGGGVNTSVVFISLSCLTT